jgi:hypothetical protein
MNLFFQKIKNAIFQPLRGARWHVSIYVEKNFGVGASTSMWVKSRWPAKENSLIHDIIRHPETQNVISQLDITENFSVATRHRLIIQGAQNERGPVGFNEEFVVNTFDLRFEMPEDVQMGSDQGEPAESEEVKK